MSDESEIPDEPFRGTQILWGRVIVLLLALALAFWLGTTFGDDASAQGRIEDQQAEIARLESQVAALEAEVAAVDAGGGAEGNEGSDPSASEPRRDDDERSSDDEDRGSRGDDEPSDEESDSTPANAEGDVTEYVVQSGDSLAAIAQEVYGDPTLWREIARANDLQEPYALTVGDTLEIPAQG